MKPEAQIDSLTPNGVGQGRRLRPAERLLEYLLTEFDRPESVDGARLPTNKELSRRLGISPGTVQSVLRKLALEGKIRARRGSGTFLVHMEDRKVKAAHRVGIGVPLAKFQAADGWISRVAGGVFQAALAGNIVIEGVSDQAFGDEAMVEELERKLGHLDALILFPYTLSPRQHFLIDDYESAGKPVVHIYPPAVNATANFVSPDFFGPCHAIAQIWRKTGRRRILFLTNRTECYSLQINISNQLRYAGLTSGLGCIHSEVDGVFTLESIGQEATVEAGYESIKQFLGRGGKRPDAIFCAGDLLALGACHALVEAGIRVPDEVSIVGATGADLSSTDCPNLTRTSNDLAKVGQTAMEMVSRRLKHQGISLPGVVIPVRFIGGSTTRPQENALAGIE